MVIEKRHASPVVGIDSIRLEAIRMRLLSQEWAGDSVTELMQALVKLHSLPPTISRDEFQSHVSLILVHIDRFAAAAQAASTFNRVITEERNQIVLNIAQTQEQIQCKEYEVKRLRDKLEREKSQVDRKAQYDALARLILDCPPCETSQKELEEAQIEASTVTEDIKLLEDTKEAVRKELMLLAHCVAGLEEGTKTLAALASDQGNRPTDSPEAMDTSM